MSIKRPIVIETKISAETLAALVQWGKTRGLGYRTRSQFVRQCLEYMRALTGVPPISDEDVGHILGMTDPKFLLEVSPPSEATNTVDRLMADEPNISERRSEFNI